MKTIDKEQIDDLMARKSMRESATIVDSDEPSTELGTGSKNKKSTTGSRITPNNEVEQPA